MKYLITASLALDMILGDPYRKTHPIVLIGKFIQRVEAFLQNWSSFLSKKIQGIILWAVIVGGSYFTTKLLIVTIFKISIDLGKCFSIWLLYTTLAAKNLADEAIKIYNLLEDSDMEKARSQLSWIVGRDTENLTAPEISRAVVETVAENTIDGIISPLFYAFIGGAPLAMAYKAVNTLDSMVGYKNEKYEEFGWFSAKIDDVFNYIPARLGGLIMLLAVGILGFDIKQSFDIVVRDAKKHKSPNSGVPEAIVAGALGIRLGGMNTYFGIPSFRAFIGDRSRDIVPEDIVKAVYISLMATFIALILGVFFT